MPDFTVKDNFPIASVIQAAQQNAQRQMQARDSANQSLIQGLQSIGQVGQSLYDQRKKTAQALALGRQFEIPDELAKTMDPEQILKVGAIKKNNIDMANLMAGLQAMHGNPGSNTAGAGSQVSGTSAPVTPGPILASNTTATPINDQPLTPPTTGQAPVPIAAPPTASTGSKSSKTMNPATFSAMMKLHSAVAPQTVMSSEDALAAGSIPHGTKVINEPAGANGNINDPKYQQKLEKQYQDMKLKALSNRSGGLGLEDAKVNQGIHLRAAVNSMYDEKTGNYTIPPSMHTELALGLARMLSPTGQVAAETIKELRQATAKEGLSGALIYMGFDPAEIGGTTQSVSNFFVHQLDRQAQTAEQNREGYMDYIRGNAPIDLNSATIAKHDKTGLNSYSKIRDKSPDILHQSQQTPGWSNENEQRLQMLLEKQKNGSIRS